MSNDLTKNVKYIDTAEAIFASSSILGKFIWEGMSNTNTLVLSDADGTILFQATAALDNDYFEFDFHGRQSTLTVTTIDGGVMLLYPFMP